MSARFHLNSRARTRAAESKGFDQFPQFRGIGQVFGGIWGLGRSQRIMTLAVLSLPGT